MDKILNFIKVGVIAIIIIVLLGYALKVIYDLFKAIYYGYKQGGNKLYLTFALIALILTLLSLPYIMKKNYVRITIIGGLGTAIYCINASKKDV